MDTEDGNKCFLCPCCKACKDCTTFQKIIDLQNKGLVIYRHPRRIEDPATSTGEVFILHNTKNIDIKPSDFIPEIEEHEVSCPRCRHIMRHAKALIQSVPGIEKKDVVGICDHCRKKAERRRIPCYDCDKIVKKFLDSLGDLIETQRSKLGRTLQSERHGLSAAKRTFELQATHENMPWLKKSGMPQDPETERILQSVQRKLSLPEGFLVLDPILYAAHKDVPWLKISKQKIPKQEKLSESKTGILYQENSEQSKTGTIFQEKSERVSKDLKFSKNIQEIQEQLKTSISEESLLLPKHISSLSPKHPATTSSLQEFRKKSRKPILLISDEKKASAKKYGATVDTIASKNILVKPDGEKVSAKKYDTPVDAKASKNILVKPDRKKISVKKPVAAISKEHFRFQDDETEDAKHKSFKYVFPKEHKKPLKGMLSHKSSGKLIKETQEKLRTKAEKERERKEELLSIKKEENEKKRLASEEKKRVSGKGLVSSTSKIRNDNHDIQSKKQREADKLAGTKDEIKDKLRKDDDTGQKKEDRKRWLGMDDSQREVGGKQVRDETGVDRGRKDFKEKDGRQQRDVGDTQKDKERTQQMKQSATTRKKEGKLQHYDDESQKEKERKQFKGAGDTQRDKEGSQHKEKDEIKSAKGKVTHDEDNSQKDKELKQFKGADDTRRDREGSQHKVKDEIKNVKEKMQHDKDELQKEKERKQFKGAGDTQRDKEGSQHKEKDEIKSAKGKVTHDVDNSQKDKERKQLKGADDTRRDKEGSQHKVKDEIKSAKGKVQHDEDESQKDKEQKQLKGADDTRRDKEGSQHKVKDEIKNVIEKKQHDKDESHKDKERKQLKGPDDTRRDKEGSQHKVKDEIKNVIEKKQHDKDESHKDKERKQLKGSDDTRRDKEGSQHKVKDEIKSIKGKVSKETQMDRDEKGKRPKETQTQKRRDMDEKQKEKDVKLLDKEGTGIHEKILEKYGKPGTKEVKLTEGKDKNQKDKEEKFNKEKLTKSEIEEKSKQEEVTANQRITDALSKQQKDEMAMADKVFADALKSKKEQDSFKNKQDDTLKKARELANKAAMKLGGDMDPSKFLEMRDVMPKTSHTHKSEMESVKKAPIPLRELNLNQIVIKTPSCDDFHLMLIKNKKVSEKKKKGKMNKLYFSPSLALPLYKIHQDQHSVKIPGCGFCDNSDLSLDIGSLCLKKTKDTGELIRGEKIVKNRPLPIVPIKKNYGPVLYKTTYTEEVLADDHLTEAIPSETVINIISKKSQKVPDPAAAVPDSVIRYALSDRSFIDKGWTLLPTEKIVRKMNIYRMRPAHPEFDWFKHHKNKQMQYDTGEALADFNDKGRGRWFYRNGRVALDYYDAEDVNAEQRYVVYSSGEIDERGRSYPITVLAMFDYSGNGVVFDHKGKIRLKYNQTEGIVLDRTLGPATHWKWHSLNDPPQLQQVMIDTHIPHKDPEIMNFGDEHDPMRSSYFDENMVAIEFDNFIKEKNKKLTCQKFKPFQIRMKALKINDQFSLRVLDQASIYLMFRDGTTNLKLNLGMLLDNKEILDTDTADVGVISNDLERLPAHTDSILNMQKKIGYAKQVQRFRDEHESRLRPQMSTASVDKLTAGISRPRRPVLLTVPSNTTVQEQQCNCSRKPLSTNLYYNNRF